MDYSWNPIKPARVESMSGKRLYNYPRTSQMTIKNMNDSGYCVYIMTDEQRTKLYTGRTSNLKRRVAQHRTGNGGVFTRRHNLVKLVYYEAVDDLNAGRERERQIKRIGKKQRIKMIEQMNPGWEDLFRKL